MMIPAIDVRRGDILNLRGFAEKVIEVRPLSSSKNSPDMCSWQVEYVAVGGVRQVYIEKDELVEVFQ